MGPTPGFPWTSAKPELSRHLRAPEWEVEPRLFSVLTPPLSPFTSSSPTWFKMVRRHALLGKLGWPRELVSREAPPVQPTSQAVRNAGLGKLRQGCPQTPWISGQAPPWETLLLRTGSVKTFAVSLAFPQMTADRKGGRQGWQLGRCRVALGGEATAANIG